MLRAQRDTQYILLNGKKRDICAEKEQQMGEGKQLCLFFGENFFRTVAEKRAPVSCGKGFV